MHLAYGFLEIYDAYVSLGRIEEFLLLENLPPACRDQSVDDRSGTNRNISKLTTKSLVGHRTKMPDVPVPDKRKDLHKSTSVRVSSLTHKPIKQEDQFILQDIEFTAESESLTVFTGPVGSGKSTLLSVIAGEVSSTSGTISFNGTLVYVPQIPWVFSGTIRENILFGEPYDESKYTRIVEACALTQDIRQFPDCDQTLVGERGEVLSGGQRARVSLARAVYADAELYLLDDPLAAVDFKVGQHIFEKCIKGLLAHKTRLITSHQEQFMKEADNVIVFYKGRTLEIGTFTELKEKGILNTAVDPLYENLNDNDQGSWPDASQEDKKDVSNNCERIWPLINEAKGLQISEEDRTTGVVTSKLYWNYFRSGVPSLVIFAVLCLCFITQGKSISDTYLKLFVRQVDKFNEINK